MLGAAFEATLSKGLIVGDRSLYRLMIETTWWFVAASNGDEAQSLVDRALGTHTSNGASFQASVDKTFAWFRPTDFRDHGTSRQDAVDALLLVQRQIGSVSLDGCVLGFHGDELYDFHVETSEGTKRRTLTALNMGNRWAGLPQGFIFESNALSWTIQQQF